MKKYILFIFVILVSAATNLFAANFEKDGIAYYILTGNTVEVISTSPQYTGSVVIPESVTYNSITYSVTTIGEDAFFGCSGLTSITIPHSVTSIGKAAFYGCSGLTSIEIPNSVTTIGEDAFAYCSGLTSITIPNSVTTIEEGAFRECSGLTSVTIPNSVTTIGMSAFDGCSGLTSVTIPNSVTTIGYYAFYNVNNIVYDGTATGSPWGARYVNKYVDGYFVYEDESKTMLCCCSTAASGEIFIPNSVTTIGNYAFIGCSGLTSITIPNSVTTIGKYTFYGCSGLTSIEIPNSVTTIGSYAFYNCSGLTSVTIPHSVTSIGDYAFYNCSGLTSVTIPHSVTSIGDWAFFGCSGLTSIEIPNSVTTIEEGAFRECSGLTSVMIGNSVKTIGRYAFAYCRGIRSVTCFAEQVPTAESNTFYDLSQYTKAYVLVSLLEDYQSAIGWKDLILQPIGATESQLFVIDQVVVSPSSDDVTITWPVSENADTYTLVITKDGEVFCTLTFNANGQLTNIAFAAPSHNGAHQAPAATLTAQGYQFTVTGLNPGTAYTYSVTATDAGGQTLAEHKGNFSTTSGGTPTSMDKVHGSQCTTHKYFHNGNLIIERNGIKYTTTGQKVR